jgi:predicted DNA-binding transcriptional regulator AlpA
MKPRTNPATPIKQTRRTRHAPISHHALLIPLGDHGLRESALDLSHPDMEQRLSARHSYEFLDEGRSTFYARMNPSDPNYDPHFPRPIPSSTTGRGPRRWKLGAIIAWLQLCESTATSI